jgi:putative membrane protein insertion efficiency factor
LIDKVVPFARRRVLSAITVVAVIAVAWNAQPLALHSIDMYQRTLAGPAARIGLRCRFTPTCSRYAATVIARDGAIGGGWRAVKRIARCGPWTPAGTSDDP